MAKMCARQMTADELERIKNDWYTVEDCLIWIQGAVVIICVIILFGYYRYLQKPAYIWAMWVLLTVGETASVIIAILDVPVKNADAAGDTEKYDRLVRN